MLLILVDTGVWIDHFRRGDAALCGMLERDDVSLVWTRDRRLHEAAERVGVALDEGHRPHP
jgi:rRNA-processing protein FCF1